MTNTYTIDAVNHGDTSHHPVMTFDDQAENILEFMDQQNIEKATLIGQSMGGRASMKCAIRYPDRVEGVMSVDSPAVSFDKFPGYTDKTYQMVKFMADLDIKGKTLSDILELMSKTFGNDVDNLKRIMRNFKEDDNSKQAVFVSNPKYILDNIETMYYFEPIGQYTGPAKMLVGGRSGRWKLEHYTECFPNLTQEDLVVVPNTGHWIHTDDPETTTKHIVDFLHKTRSHKE